MYTKEIDAMKTIFIVMDSLNRHYLNAYGKDWVKTPNLDRLAEKSTVFDSWEFLRGQEGDVWHPLRTKLA